MDDELLKQQQRCDLSWQQGLQSGKLQRGNLLVNLAFLEKTALITPQSKILEIGCGIGRVVYELSQKGCDVIGTDISGEAITFGQKEYPGINLEVQPAEHLPYEDGTFDIVLSFDLFEHIAKTDLHVSEVSRLLKPGGYYLFQTPNKLYNAAYETLKTKGFSWKQYHPSLHTSGQLRRRLERFNFDVQFVKMNTINEFTLKKLGRLGFLFKHINFEKLPLWMQTNLYVIAQKGSVSS